ncbi:MAG: hypothetical protein AB8G11_24630 [Saprospiraceae bacterium]
MTIFLKKGVLEMNENDDCNIISILTQWLESDLIKEGLKDLLMNVKANSRI